MSDALELREEYKTGREERLAAIRAPAKPATASDPQAEHTQPKKKGRPAQRDLLLDAVARTGYELGISRNTAYMRLRRGGHIETFPIHSDECRRALMVLGHDNELVISRNAIDEARDALEARAYAEGNKIEVHQRAGRVAVTGRDGDSLLSNVGIVVDPGWADRSLLLLEGAGPCRIEADDRRAPWFIRGPGFISLPAPAPVGDLDEIWNFANIAQEDRLLVLAIMVHSWRSHLAQPILDLGGEQGTAKTSTARTLRRFMDPNTAAVCPLPKTPDELLVVCAANRVSIFDNLSGLDADMADSLCVVATRGARVTRKLYTDGDLSMIHAEGSVILTGISEIGSRGDLADRLVVISLPRIEPTRRRAEADLDRALEESAPRIFKGFLDRVDATLSFLPSVESEKRERGRMADFSNTGEALARSMGLAPGSFDQRMAEASTIANEVVIDASPLAALIIRRVRERGPIYAAPGAALADLAAFADERETRAPYWPRSASALSTAVRRIAPALRRANFTVEVDRNHAGRFIHVQQIANIVTPRHGDTPTPNPTPEEPDLW